jgi:hypothetical protein
MITISDPPTSVYYVVQMKSEVTGNWVDTMATNLDTEVDLTRSLRHWRMIHPLREFRPVKRTVTDQPLIEVYD